MADTLCPACGKANPEELEICQYCGALLKNRGTEPLPPIRPGEMPTTKKTSELESTLPGWLRSIRKGGADENTAAAASEDTGAPLPSFSTPEPAKPEAPKKKAAESPLDLLAGLSQSNEEEDDVPDWLASLKSNMPGGPVPSPEPINAEPPPADAPAAEPQQAADWLSSLQAQDENRNIPAQPTPAESSSTEEEIPSTGSLPGWLNSLGNESTPQAATSIPSSPLSEPVEPAPDIPASADMSEWFAGLENESPAAVPAESTPAAEPEPAAAGDLPDWMAGLGSPSEAALQAPSSFETPGENVPGEETPAAADSAPGEGLPDWLTAAIEEKAADAPPVDSHASKAFSTGALDELAPLDGTDSLPDWMTGLGTSGAAPAPAPTSPEPEQLAPPTLSTNPAPDADTFDWLAGMAEGGSKPVETEPASGDNTLASSTIEKPETESVSFDPLAPEAATPFSAPAGENEQNLDSILSMDMPDWLSGFAPTESEPGKAAGSALAGDDISPANLPSWVQAMRPMEAVISGTKGGDEDQNIEKEGPLAGLRSVLPGQVEALGLHKPKAYSIKLQVDATQKAQAALLENLIASEAESHPISISGHVVNIRPLRWVIAGILLLMVLIPALTGPTGLFPVPAVELNGEIHLFQQKIDGLPQAAAVLVAFDYQPGYAGEMEQAVGPVIANLVQKNARMVFVSTSPLGTLMSERIMAQYPSYKLNEQYINLGYLPGDAAGVEVFADHPHILGSDYRYPQSLWLVVDPDPAKRTLNDLGDFNGIIILTDNPDTARTWIEQTSHVRSPEKPMLMVLSAQAEPMIRPYYLSGQIQGMLSGLAGATAYQQANPYWDSYATGMMAAELLITFGGIWALVENLRARRATQHENDEEDEA